MMKQLIEQAKIRFFDANELSEAAVRRLASPGQLSAEQQRIKLLENQLHQLRCDMARWKNSSRCFAHEMRDLLND